MLISYVYLVAQLWLTSNMVYKTVREKATLNGIFKLELEYNHATE